MSLLDDILAHNKEYVEDQNTGYVETDTKCSKMPSRQMAIVTCMFYRRKKGMSFQNRLWPCEARRA